MTLRTFATVFIWAAVAPVLCLTQSGPLQAIRITGDSSAVQDCQPGTEIFTACYYWGVEFNHFLLRRQDKEINFDWTWGAPYAGGPSDLFSVRWEGDFTFSRGTFYRFVMKADDGARLFIDGRLVADRWTDNNPWNSFDVVVPMTAGTHRIKLEHFEAWGPAAVKLTWQPDTGGRDFYISASGSDNNDGRSPSNPWRSVGKVSLSTFHAGDRIFFEGGKSFEGTIYFSEDDKGTAAKPIVVTSYGNGRATIRPGALVGLLAYNTAGIEVRDLNFVGSPGNAFDGIQFYQDLPNNVKLRHIRVDNVETSGFGHTGVSIHSWAETSGYDDVRLTNISTHDNLMGGIIVGGYLDEKMVGYAHRNVYIADCEVFNNPGISLHWRDTGIGILLGSTDGAVIERNVAYENGKNSTTAAGPMGIMAWESNNVIIQYNEVHHTRTSGGDGGGIDLDGGMTNSIIQYNYTHDNEGSGLNLAQYGEVRNVHSNNIVRYNISQNDGRKSISWAGIAVWNATGAMRNSQIYNNTIFGTPNGNGLYHSMIIVSPTTNFTIRNNVFITTGGMGQLAIVNGQNNMRLQGNSYWGSGSPLRFGWGSTSSPNLTEFRRASGMEMMDGSPTGLEVNPRLNAPGTGVTFNDVRRLATFSAYRPQESSPLVNSGLSLFELGLNPGSQDFAGASIPRDGAFDVGALEATGTLP